MAGGTYVNGVFTTSPGVYITPEFANLSGRSLGTGFVALVGSLPFLESKVPYLSTGQSQFEALAPRDPTLLSLSNIVWNPSEDPALPGRPAGIYLVNVDETTQAQVYLQNSTPANAVLLKSRIWGPRGNLTRVTLAQNASLGGVDVIASNNGVVVDTFRVADDDAVITLGYDNPYTVDGTTAKGFAGTAGLGSGGAGVINVAKSGSDITLVFQVDLPEAAIDDTGASDSWLPSGPVNGPVTVIALADSALGGSATHLMVEFYGFAAGVAVTERLRIAAADITTPAAAVTATSWSSLTRVKAYPVNATGSAGVPGTAGTPAGTYGGDELRLSGACFATMNATNGQTYAADVIQLVNSYASDGFTASTSSPFVATTLVASLDTKTSTDIVTSDTSLSATAYRLVEAINAKSTLLQATQVLQTEVALPASPDTLVVALSGGTVSAGSASDYEDALEVLEWYDVNTVVPLSNSSAIHALCATHCNTMSGVGANERNAWVGADGMETFAALTARATALNLRHVSIQTEDIDVVQYNGATVRMAPMYYAVMAACAENGNRRTPLTGKSLRVQQVYRHSALYTRDAITAMLAAGLNVTVARPGQPLRFERWVTTYTGSTDPSQTEGSAMDSTYDCCRAVRNAVRPLIGSNGTTAVKGVIEGIVRNTLDWLVKDGVIRSWVVSSLVVQELTDRYIIRFTYSPAYPVNFILATPTIQIPFAAAAA